MKALLAGGADINASTNVVDLASLTQVRGFGRAAAQGGGQGAQGARVTGCASRAGAQGAQRSAGAGCAGAPAAAPAQGAGPWRSADLVVRRRAGAGRRHRAVRDRAAAVAAATWRRRAARGPDIAGVTRQFRFNELVAAQGGLTPLLFAARQGHIDAATALIDAGADVNQLSKGDNTPPLLMAIINGHFDLAKVLIERGADVKLASDNGVTPLYATLNVQWAPKALYPAAARLRAAEALVPRPDEDPHRQGRRRQRAPEDEGVVLGLQLRPRRAWTKSARRRSGARPTPPTSRR